MGGGPVAPEDLKGLLTPALLSLIVAARLPYAKRGRIDFSKFGPAIFIWDDFGPRVKDNVWPVLIALSKIGLDRMPDLWHFLPPPTDPSFPEQCLGLQLLLDHCPRLLFAGVDQRYTYAYFSYISQTIARKWHALPQSEQPGNWDRLQTEMDLDYWIGIRFWLGTPFVHSENPADHEIAVAYTEETRRLVETLSGEMDPNRAKHQEIFSDIYGFPRMYRRGPPEDKSVTREEFTWWMCKLMDIHEPIIARFGHYPYLNAVRGTNSTTEEKKWIEETDHFGEVSKEVAKKIRQDVEEGKWRPLGEDSD